MDNFTYIGNTEINSIDNLYKQYLENPESVDQTWRDFFKGFDFALSQYQTIKKTAVLSEGEIEKVNNEFKVTNLIHDYRQRGHFFTKTNPVRDRRKYYPTLDLVNFGLTEKDLDTVFQAGNHIGIGSSTLRNIIEHLQQTYCQSVGVEYLYIRKPEIIEWLQKKMENVKNKAVLTTDERKHIFHHLVTSVGFEKFVHKKFVGQKRFSLEGGEALIPALDAVIETGAEMGIEEFVIGMPHRGRLNVLTNIMNKPYENIFQEFVGKAYDEHIALGDVKYHLGYDTSIISHEGKEIHLHLVPNPSHLEMSDAVAEGISKAKLVEKYDKDYKKLAPILIHGDAAVATQGIVYEVIQMSQLEGYKTGGTIHLIVNNQVGFTTNYLDARSSIYCTDIAKVTNSPVFHVNGDDVEALIYTVRLAIEYRQKFHADVFIDILGYRKYGHNEGDEPRFTQPVLYKIIANHPSIREIYAQQLIEYGIYTADEIQRELDNFDSILEEKLALSKEMQKVSIKQFLSEEFKGFKYPKDTDFQIINDTKVDRIKLIDLASKINSLPVDKKFFNKVYSIVEDRKKMVETDRLDWAMGELLAYASLLEEGIPVRLSGQDCERGTFSHRHAAFVLEDTDERYYPLKNISDSQAQFHVFNSLLSEYGVLGFEYGYALATPKSLTIWEAQFGDFHNVAQPVIDQYICSGEEKWGLMNGLVLYLPHGFEGQGPEHSSARIERFLTLAARNNMQVVNCTTPANLFHLLRRQIHRDFRVPLVVFTPKSLLRHPECVSTLSDLSDGYFQEVIDDTNVNVNDVTRVVYCSGKIYYDLLEKKKLYNATDLAIIRVEQLHPFPHQQLKQISEKYEKSMLSLWVQEEPENMGAWNYIRTHFNFAELIPVARMASGSPAVGLHHLHVIQQNEIIYKVFRKCDCELKNNYCGLQCVKGRSREEILKQHYYL